MNCPLLLFADDTVLYTSAETQEESVELLQEGINKLMLWTRASMLTINAGKSKTMFINPKKRKKAMMTPELLMGSTRLEPVKVYKYLGVLIDYELTFKDHIKQIIRNCARKVYLLRRIRKTIMQRAAAAILKAMIIPLMDYRDVFYSSGPKGLLSKLDALLRRALRIVVGLARRDELDVDEVMGKLNIMPLSDRRQQHLLEHIRWIVGEGRYADDRELPTRAHSGKRKTQRIETPNRTVYLNSFLYRGLSDWNTLPEEIQTITDPNVFKTRIRELLQRRRGTLAAHQSN